VIVLDEAVAVETILDEDVSLDEHYNVEAKLRNDSTDCIPVILVLANTVKEKR
jgi:hypothetical protein